MTAPNKQSPYERKFAHSGHPVWALHNIGEVNHEKSFFAKTFFFATLVLFAAI
jgi:hypothetical protein